MRCEWCNTDPEEAAAQHEGPHATWCVHFRQLQQRVMDLEERVRDLERIEESDYQNRQDGRE